MRGRGVGLAAPQVGVSKRIIVVKDTDEYIANWPAHWIEGLERKPFAIRVVVNPVIEVADDALIEWYEACLSKPQEPRWGLINRWRAVRVTGLDEHGQRVSYEAKGWEARIFQHEVDHLNGRLCFENFVEGSAITQDEYEALKEQPLPPALGGLMPPPKADPGLGAET